MLNTQIFDKRNIFRLRFPVGPMEVNKTTDVAKVETMLDRLGFIAMNQRQGPSGEFHSELDQGLRKFQVVNRLKEDAKVNPDGPTLLKMAQEIAEDPGPNNIDDTAPKGDGSGIKDLKVNTKAAQDILKAVKNRMENVVKGFKIFLVAVDPEAGLVGLVGVPGNSIVKRGGSMTLSIRGN